MSCDNSLASIWPDDLLFVVPQSGGTYINADESTITLPAEFANWKVRVTRNNVPMDYGDQGLGDPYYTRDIDLNVVVLSMPASYQDKFMIQAYKPYN